jgi:hypothetical protein
MLYAALVLGAVYGFRVIRKRALDLEEFRVRPDTLAIVKRPTWLATDVVGELRRDLAGAPALSLFDPGLSDALRGAVVDNPWVEEVKRVHRRFPDQVVLHAKLRRPVAALSLSGPDGPYALLDESGRVLKTRVPDLRAWRERSAGIGLPFEVRGVRSTERLRPGRIVADPVLREAAALAKDLEAFVVSDAGREVGVVALNVAGLDFGNAALDAGVALETASGAVIEWGHSSRSRLYGEPSYDEKVAGLEKVLARYPRLRGLRTVFLRMPDPWVTVKRRPDIPEE